MRHEHAKMTIPMTVLSFLLLAPAYGWEESVHLPGGEMVTFPALEVSTRFEWSLELWLQASAEHSTWVTDPSAQFGHVELDVGAATMVCHSLLCTVTVRSVGATEASMTFPWYPLVVYAIRIDVWPEAGDTRARVWLSGSLYDEITIAGELPATLAPMSITQSEINAHAFFLPVRMWDSVDRDPRRWLFQHPAPTDPGLLGMWRRAAGTAVIDETAGGHDGTMSLGAQRLTGVRWDSPDLILFSSDFEAGDLTRWDAVP